MQVFNDSQASADDIAAAGEAFLLVLYGGKPDGSHDKLRYSTYTRTLAKHPVHAQFDLATLPTTSAAGRQHSYRAFHQVQQLLGNALDPTVWDWKLKTGRLRPVTKTLKEPVPPTLLHLITCNCEKGCEVNCVCRRCGLPCIDMCGYCAGHGCNNQESFDEDEEGEADGYAEEYSKTTENVDDF